MGLDSVELIMEMENYFGIHIPDRMAEKISTVQNAVDVIAEILIIKQENSPLKEEVFTRVQKAFIDSGFSPHPVKSTDFLIQFIPEKDHNAWDQLSNKTGLIIPKPIYGHSGIMKKFSFFSWQPDYRYHKLTVNHFIDVVCAANYKKLLNREIIQSKEDIYFAVIAITVDKCGVDFYEVLPHKVFTNDFGID